MVGPTEAKMSAIDQVIEFAKVLGSAVLGRNAGVAYNLSGTGTFLEDASGDVFADDASDEGGERADEQHAYQSLGVVYRPLPPEGELHCESVAARTSDGLEPFAYRDLRINRALNPTGAGTAPKEGQGFFAGYAGAFLSHELGATDSGDQKPNVTTLYLPYSFSSGVPAKAHVVVIDPYVGIQIINGEGAFLSLANDVGNGEPGIVWGMSAESFGRISESEVVIHAPKIMLKGVCYLGSEADAGLPLLAGPSSPPSPSIYVSPV